MATPSFSQCIVFLVGLATLASSQCVTPDPLKKTFFPLWDTDNSGLMILNNQPGFAIALRIEKAFYNPVFESAYCQGDYPTAVTTVADANNDCKNVVTAVFDYLNDCNFDVTVDPADNDFQVFSGEVRVTVNAQVPFFGQQLVQDFSRPFQFTIRMKTTFKVETTISVEGDVCYVDSDCNGRPCVTTGGYGSHYCDCTPTCRKGLNCMVDNCPPVLNCPGDIDINLDNPYALNITIINVVAYPPYELISPVTPVTWSDYDTASEDIIIQRQISGAQVESMAPINVDNLHTIHWPYGVSLVTYSATDVNPEPTNVAPLTSTCQFKVRVKDIGPPVITCPDDILTRWPTGWMTPTATDNIDNSPVVTQISGPQPYGNWQQGTHTVTYKAVDFAGNEDTCSFTILYDFTPPVWNVTCPAVDITTNVDTCDSNCATVTWEDPNHVNDNSGEAVNMVLAPSREKGFCFPPGIYKSVYIASDALGNSASCGWQVEVIDHCPPVVTCQTDVQYYTEQGKNYATINVNTLGTATDNVGLKYGSPTSFPVAQIYAVGAHAFTYKACDNANLCVDCQITFEVIDNEPPVITFCPVDFTVATTHGSNSWTAMAGSSAQGQGWETVTATDNVGVVSITSDGAYGTAYPVGTHTITTVVKDAAGLTATCQFDVTVTDNEDPIIRCPEPPASFFEVFTEPGKAYWIADWTVSTEPLPLNQLSTSLDWGITFGDNVQVDMSAFLSNYSPGDQLQAAANAYTITYSIKDTSGNSDSCSFDVKVTDNEKPVLTCNDINAFTGDDKTYAVVTYDSSATDNFGLDTTIGENGMTFVPGASSHFAVGVHTVTVTVIDVWSNFNTCTFKVTVEGKCGDALLLGDEECDGGVGCQNCKCEGDTFLAKEPIDFGCDEICTTECEVEGDCSMTVFLNNAPSVDSATVSVDITRTPEQEAVIDEFLVHVDFVAEWGIKDEDQDALEAGESVEIEICCNKTLIPPHPLTAAVYKTNPDGTLSALTTYDDCIERGVNIPTRVSIDKDSDGANDCYKFHVCSTGIVEIGCLESDLAPFGTCLKPEGFNITAQVAAGSTSAVITWDPADHVLVDYTASTFQIVMFSNYQSGDSFTPGEYTLEYTITDWNTGSMFCEIPIIVEDKAPPVFTPDCSSGSSTKTLNNPVWYAQYNKAYAVYMPPVMTAYDGNDGNIPVTTQYSPAAPFEGNKWPLGTTVVTYTAADSQGNVATCVLTVNIVDTTDPTLYCDDLTVNNDKDQDDAVIVNFYQKSADNVEPIKSHLITFDDAIPIGTHTKQFCYTDENANGPVCCDYQINVIDYQPPVFQCPPLQSDGSYALIRIPTTGGPTVVYNYNVGPTDNDPTNLQWSANIGTGTALSIGTHRFSLYAIDSNPQNGVSCIFDVEVYDNTPPSLSCPNPPEVIMVNSKETSTGHPYTNMQKVTIPPVTVVDNSGETLTAVTDYFYAANDARDTFDLGLTLVTFYAVDSAGNRGECTVSVTILDGVAPDPVDGKCPVDLERFSADSPAKETYGNWPIPEDIKHIFWDNVETTDATNSMDPLLDPLDLGENYVSYKGLDARLNEGYCNFTVTLYDNEAPNIDCPSDKVHILQGTAGGKVPEFYTHSWDITATDDWTPSDQITWTEARNFPTTGSTTLKLGVHNFYFSATDLAGNIATCNYQVEVTTELHFRLECPSEHKKRLPDPDTPSMPINYWEPAIAYDDWNSTIVITYDPPSGSNFLEGEHDVLVTATDPWENTITCTFQVVILPAYVAPAVEAILNSFLVSQDGDLAYGLGSFTTGVNFPYTLYLGTDHQPADAIVYLEEDVALRRCPVGEEGKPCINTWNFRVDFTDCSAANIMYQFKFKSNCYPADCTYNDAGFSVGIYLDGDSYCETSLAPATVDATVTALLPETLADFVEEQEAIENNQVTTTAEPITVKPAIEEGVCSQNGGVHDSAAACQAHADDLGFIYDFVLLDPLDYRPAGCYVNPTSTPISLYFNPLLTSTEPCSAIRQCLCDGEPDPNGRRRQMVQNDNVDLLDLINIGDSTFDARLPIPVLVRVTSPNVLLKSVSLLYAKHESFTSETKEASSLYKETLFVENSQVVAPTANNVTFDDSKRNYVVINYRESDFPLETILYVRITTKVMVEYILGPDDVENADSGARRRLVEATYDRALTRRAMQQAPGGNLGAFGIGAWRIGDPNARTGGNVDVRADAQTPTTEAVPAWALWTAIVLMVLVMSCCCCYCCSHLFHVLNAKDELEKLGSDSDAPELEVRGSRTTQTGASSEMVTMHVSPRIDSRGL